MIDNKYILKSGTIIKNAKQRKWKFTEYSIEKSHTCISKCYCVEMHFSNKCLKYYEHFLMSKYQKEI